MAGKIIAGGGRRAQVAFGPHGHGAIHAVVHHCHVTDAPAVAELCGISHAIDRCVRGDQLAEAVDVQQQLVAGAVHGQCRMAVHCAPIRWPDDHLRIGLARGVAAGGLVQLLRQQVPGVARGGTVEAAVGLADDLAEDVLAALDVGNPAGGIQWEIDGTADLHPVVEVHAEVEAFIDTSRRVRIRASDHFALQRDGDHRAGIDQNAHQYRYIHTDRDIDVESAAGFDIAIARFQRLHRIGEEVFGLDAEIGKHPRREHFGNAPVPAEQRNGEVVQGFPVASSGLAGIAADK